MASTWQTEASETDGTSRPAAGCPHEFAPGTHLVTARRGYLHHGIYVGGGKVVHYAGLSRYWRRGPVEEVPLEQFAGGRPVQIKPAAYARFSHAEIVARARSRLGENCYRITSNNCEHLCEWCIHGEAQSEQVDAFLGGLLRKMLRPRPFAMQG